MKRREFITPLESAARTTNATKQKEQVLKNDGPETMPDGPPIDLRDAAVKELISGAKKRGYVTHDQINALLPSEEVQSEQIEDILVMFSEMGVNVIETKEAEPEETPEDAKGEPEEEENDGELMEGRRSTPAETKKSEPGERTDDPVRMYLREMGSVELLSREGEIATAKRIEAGREAMITGLCENPLTFQAIII
jgi:RNA polymerase primary sigma factor